MAKVKVLVGPIDSFKEGDEMEIVEGATLDYFLKSKFVERVDEEVEKLKAKSKAKPTTTTTPDTSSEPSE